MRVLHLLPKSTPSLSAMIRGGPTRRTGGGPVVLLRRRGGGLGAAQRLSSMSSSASWGLECRWQRQQKQQPPSSTASSFLLRPTAAPFRIIPSSSFVPPSSSNSGITMIRGYSTSSPVEQSSSSTLLADLLTRERAEEIENDTLTVPQELVDLKAKLESDNHWKIVDVGATTRLTRALPNVPRSKVVIHFHCQDIIEDLDEVTAFHDDQGATEGGDEEPEVVDEEEVAGAVRFTVAVSTPSQKTLVFQCVTDYGQVQIRSVTTTSMSVDELFQGGTGGSGDVATTGATAMVGNPKDYQGPVFDELAGDVQQAFHQYLSQEVGVNEDVAAFVSMHADYREQVCYVQFLDECHDAVSTSSSS